MTDFASFADERAITVEVCMPRYGLWSADVVLASSAPIPSVASPLVIGDLTLLGTVFRAASFAGARSARVVGGYGGWDNSVPAQDYRGANVRVSTVLRDAATAVGEKIQIDMTDSALGRFTRANGPASRVLRLISGDSWWVAPDGVTHAGPRPGGPITSEYQVINWGGRTGRFQIATEHIADWLPGRTFTAPADGVQTIGYTEISMTNQGKLRLEVLAS